MHVVLVIQSLTLSDYYTTATRAFGPLTTR